MITPNGIAARIFIFMFAAALLAGSRLHAGQPPQARHRDALPATQGRAPAQQPKIARIDLDQAKRVELPTPRQQLTAVNFETPDGRTGWVVRVPGGHPIATPAYADGMIFLGGGYGSHELYAFNAETGVLVWQTKTSDDGPTAAVVEDGYVAFNTESCTLIITDARTGRIAWQQRLGDPLMSQPAIAQGRVYMAYPVGRTPTAKLAPQAPGEQVGPYHLLSTDLKTGRHLWEQAIPADVISAPIVVAE
jgi:outer membrane protein assembly factor BamB